MFAAKFYVDTKRKNALMLRVTNNRKKAELSLGFQMTEDVLNDLLSTNSKSQNARMRSVLRHWQSIIEDIKIDLAKEMRDNEDAKTIRDIISTAFFGEKEAEDKNAASGEFVVWFCKFADSHNSPQTRTRKDYYHTLSRLKSFARNLESLNFSDITVGWLEDFDRYLSATCRLNSRNHHMRNIRAVFKYALRHDLDIRNPFDRMRLKTEQTAKRSLNTEEVREVFTMEVLPYAEIYRDMFKLSFMLIGINPIDLFRLKRISSHGRVDYQRAKTHKPYSIKVEPEALEIIEKYQGTDNLLMLAERWKLPSSFGAAANKALRSLGSKPAARGRKRSDGAKFPELSLYWARHTWATIAAELDIPDATISLALGHSGENRVTDIYIRRNQRKVDEANRRVLDWVLYGKR
ncbi:site-specific integrase [Duncaniella muris]|uniref:tyrosine-type recombinase/integrase n=4 Tax=Duncaniella TaxID=2518495 RepID=UPI0025B78985|nr:site-specific integrase [Duncaniella muris]